jgi:nucleoside-triphosphatase THEP1
VRDTKLILIDGLPGSGKSTTARFLGDTLARRGVAVRCFLETAPDHPLNVGGSLHPAGGTTGAELFAHYTPGSYIDESVGRWRAFVEAAERANAVHVAESYPYQNAVRVLLQMDAELDRMRTYAAEVEQIVEPLRPVLIFLERRDTAGALRAIAEQRGTDWTAYLAELLSAAPYSQQRGLRGSDAAVAFISAYKALVDELRSVSRMPALVLEDCGGQWEACHRRILEFLAV